MSADDASVLPVTERKLRQIAVSWAARAGHCLALCYICRCRDQSTRMLINYFAVEVLKVTCLAWSFANTALPVRIG
jgi:hypothetical protein